MRKFEYFLFENFDAEEEAQNPHNPRAFLGKDTDPILSMVANRRASYFDGCGRFGDARIQKLIDSGVLRQENGTLLFDSPVFLREDAAILYKAIAEKAAFLADQLEKNIVSIRECCGEIRNGCSVKQNLYHILCGMIFDGHFFDYLSDNGVLATSRKHPSGLDYLNVIYEKCDALQTLSDGLLCSYNRLVNDRCALQSFGDAQGNRLDFYRLFRLMEQRNTPDKFQEAARLLTEAFGGPNKDALLAEAERLVQSGQCAPAAGKLFELLGYTKNGVLCVPVYTAEHQIQIRKIENIVENCLGKPITHVLMDLAGTVDITAVRHGVSPLEIANELYHIVFGLINEELVSREIVAAPQLVPGEGRYLKCIEMYGMICAASPEDSAFRLE